MLTPKTGIKTVQNKYEKLSLIILNKTIMKMQKFKILQRIYQKSENIRKFKKKQKLLKKKENNCQFSNLETDNRKYQIYNKSNFVGKFKMKK